MGTQAIVSLVKDGEVQLKVITGSAGYNAGKLASWLKTNLDAKPSEVYDHALSITFGSKYDLVVQHGRDKFITDPDMGEIPELYNEKFNDPKFNPRWDNGTADHVVVVNANALAPKPKRPRP